MRILAVSVAPLFRDRIQGGSQRILMEVVDALAEAGHEVRVLSPSLGDVAGFQTPHGALIKPSLELRGSFPAPYQTTPHRLTSTWNVLREEANRAERAYLHADAVYMRSALGDLPVIRSLHDFVYEESLLSAFTLPADRTIVPSRYLRDCIEASAGAVASVGEITVVPNGIAAHDLPVQPMLPQGIEARRDGDLILLHPHRLHREKGIEESIRTAAEVQARLPHKRVRLLVPALQPETTADDAVVETASITEFARSFGAGDMLELHQWLPPQSMPGYFAAGDVTLCPGSFVEAFGLVPLESVVAGTPAICSRVGALREHTGLQGITHFDYGDIAAAAEAVVRAVTNPPDPVAAATAIAHRYDLAEMKNSYVEAVTGPLPSNARMQQRRRSPEQSTAWKLAPWCYVSGDRVYHDYLARFESFPLLAESLGNPAAALETATLTTASELGELERARKLGFIVPA